MSKEKIGFIGVGLMGHGMAKNIVEKGFALSVLGHRNRAPVDDLVARGASEASQHPRACRSERHHRDLRHRQPGGRSDRQRPRRAGGAGKKLMIVDCSTSDPSSTIRLAAALKDKGITLIDAPLSRTPKDAEEGTLDVMVGGAAEDVARARPVIDCFAGRVVHTGPTGSGHTMKLLNNFVSLGYAALYSEALALGAKAGLTPQVFDAVIRGGRMDCPFYQTFAQYVVGRDPNAHRFAIRNALKDLTYLAGFANASGMANPVSGAVRNSYALAVSAGQGERYVPMLSDFIAELNGVSLASK